MSLLSVLRRSLTVYYRGRQLAGVDSSVVVVALLNTRSPPLQSSRRPSLNCWVCDDSVTITGRRASSRTCRPGAGRSNESWRHLSTNASPWQPSMTTRVRCRHGLPARRHLLAAQMTTAADADCTTVRHSAVVTTLSLTSLVICLHDHTLS